MELKDTLLETLCLVRNLQYCHCDQHCKFNNSMGQGKILLLLKEKGELRTLEIANLLNVNVSTANEFVQKLIKQGYVKRLTDVHDKRIKKITLTKMGKNIKINDEPLSNHIFDHLSKKQLADFKCCLNTINNNLKKINDDE